MEQQNTKEVGVKYSGQQAISSLHRQRGFVFKLIHSLMIVALVVILVVLYKGGKLAWLENKVRGIVSGGGGASTQTYPERRDNYLRANQREYRAPVERPQEDSAYTEEGRYAVQVAAGYDSRQLYGWRDELLQKGYDAYLVSLTTSRGMMFKLRVGAYYDRQDAEAMRDRLSRRYPTNFGDSFIVEGE